MDHSREWRFRLAVALNVLLALVLLGVLKMNPARAAQASLSPEEEEAHLRFQSDLIRKTDNYRGLEWLGKPIWQSVLDLWTLQETIFQVKPALIVECGTWRGGSSYYLAQLLDLMGKGRVVTVDIERMHNLSHPRVTYLIGDSVSDPIVNRVRKAVARAGGPVMVILDSSHAMSHVLKELEIYSAMVTPGSYIHVQDGVIDIQPMFAAGRPGPLRAIEAFLTTHPEFEVDAARSDRFLITHHPKGWLRRTVRP
jgi:cephalosporin hydroxylase